MTPLTRFFIAALISPCLFAAAPGPLPPDLAPFFGPPAEFAGNLGTFRPVLTFNDGTPVQTAADWQRRR